MTWLLLLKIVILIFFIYICVRALIEHYFKQVAICEATTYQVIGDYRKANGVDLV